MKRRFVDGNTDTALHGAAVIALAGSVVLTPSGLAHGPVICPFRAITALPCPLCGLTRSFVAMGHADPLTAFDHHAFGPLLFLAALTMIALRVATVARGRPAQRWTPSRPARLALWSIAGVLLVWSIWRLISAL